MAAARAIFKGHIYAYNKALRVLSIYIASIQHYSGAIAMVKGHKCVPYKALQVLSIYIAS
jgi:hypothetical protein